MRIVESRNPWIADVPSGTAFALRDPDCA